MQCYRCGTKVVTKLSNIEGIITGVTIRFKAMAYEISYFFNAEYRQIWMNESEFDVMSSEKQKIGFIK